MNSDITESPAVRAGHPNLGNRAARRDGQGCTYGDEFQCATDYPLVRITNTATGNVI